MEKIEVTIDGKTGAMKIETSGFKGNACRAATADLEKAMGGKIDETLKPEFHQTSVGQQATQGGGK